MKETNQSMKELLAYIKGRYPHDLIYNGSPIPMPFINRGDNVISIENWGIENAPDIIIRFLEIPRLDYLPEILDDSTCWQAITSLLHGFVCWDEHVRDLIMSRFDEEAEQRHPKGGIFRFIDYKIVDLEFVQIPSTFKTQVFASIRITQPGTWSFDPQEIVKDMNVSDNVKDWLDKVNIVLGLLKEEGIPNDGE